MISALQNRIHRYRRFLRLKPFDSSTVQGERDERYRRAMFSSATLIAGKIVSLIVGLYTVYIATPVLGADRYGVWNSVIAISNLIAVFDLGIPASLVNRTAHSRIEGPQSLRLTLTVGLISISAIGIVASLIYAGIALYMPWKLALNSNDASLHAEAQWAAIWAAPILWIQLLNGSLTNILLGLQRAFLSNLISILISILNVFAIYLAVHYAPNPAGFIWATQGITIISAIILFAYLATNKMLCWPVSFKDFAAELKSIWMIGKPLFMMSIILAVTLNLDVLLASAFLDPAAIAKLVTAQRLFQIYLGVGLVIALPLWSAYADAHAKHDYHFIRMTLLRSIVLVSAIILVFIPPTVYFATEIFRLWTHGTVIPDMSLIISVALSASIGLILTTFGYFLNGCGIMRPQITANVLNAIAGISLKCILVFIYGVEGIVIAGILGAVIGFGLAYAVLHRKEISNELGLGTT